MSRKQSLQKMREILIERRIALQKAIEGDFSMLRKLDRSGGDVAGLCLGNLIQRVVFEIGRGGNT